MALATASEVGKIKKNAIAQLKQGEAKEKKGDAAGAIRDYEAALDALLTAIKLTNDAKVKLELREICGLYLDRAERVKRGLKIDRKVEEVKKAAAERKQASCPANVDPALFRQLEGEISEPTTTFDDIVGLYEVKQALNEMIIWPAMRPDLFSDLLEPPKGLLLFGPPGNGKTMIAKAVAGETHATFFNVSAASLVSKAFGEAEKLMRALFALAKDRQPSIIFMDEVDSFLSKRTADEHDAMKRLKTEFLVQFNSILDDKSKDRVTVICATNIPEQLDDAVLRRLTRKVYIGPPDAETRAFLFKHYLKDTPTTITAAHMKQLVEVTDTYSSSDIRNLCKDAAYGPVREVGLAKLQTVKKSDLPKVSLRHFEEALVNVPPSVSKERLREYEKWNEDNNNMTKERLSSLRDRYQAREAERAHAPPLSTKSAPPAPVSAHR